MIAFKKMMNNIFLLFKVGLFIYILIMGLVYVFQRNLLYMPSEKYEHPFKEIIIKNQGEEISVIVLNEGKSDALIYFGGNGEAVVFNAEKFQSVFSNKTVYLMNYRGYGGSSGAPSESGLFSDSLALYDAVKSSHEKISTAGRSLGSGVAVYLSVNRQIQKTVLITPYDSILNVAKNKFGFLPVSFLLKDKYESLSRVQKIKSKTLVIAAEHDQIIPISHSEKLVNEFPSEQIEYKVIKNSGHNNLSNRDDYYKHIHDFFVERYEAQ